MLSLTRRFAPIAAAAALVGTAPQPALASSTDDAYGHQASIVSVRPHPSQGLPFTGLDVALLAAGGAGLVGLGVAIRRTSDWLG